MDQKEEHKIDFRIPGLSHSVAKEAEHLRVQNLVQRIENHPHRAALQADLQQNNVYNPSSKKLKEMIRELGNVELFELREITPLFPMSLLESRNPEEIYQTKTGCTLYPGQRDKESRDPWCSTRQDRSTKRIQHGLECVEEML